MRNITKHYKTLQNITKHYKKLQNITKHYKTLNFNGFVARHLQKSRLFIPVFSMVTLLALSSCQEFREGPELASSREDVTYQVLPPVLDPSGRISFANLVSFSDFVEKNADKPGEELVFF